MNHKILVFLVSTTLPLLSLRSDPNAPWWSPTSGGKGASGVAQIGGSRDESDSSGGVRVDVVVDMTEAGKKVARPTPNNPAFYLPVPLGYREFGYAPFFKRPPPLQAEVERMLSVALAQQGYQLMSKLNQPSIVLTFWWGYMAPPDPGTQQLVHVPPATKPGGLNLSTDPKPLQMFAQGSAEPGIENASDAQMRQLVGGDTYAFETNSYDPRKQEVLSLRLQPRYYFLVSAFDFDSWLKSSKKMKNGRPGAEKPILLWRAHISTELWGHYFDQVAQTLITAAAPWFGRETPGPQLATTPLIPTGRVILGTPEVTDFATKSAAPEK